MSHRIIISTVVAAQFLSAASDYEGIQEGLGEKLEIEIEALLQSIATHPALYPAVFGSIRRALIRRFNQHLYYRIDGETVVVVELRNARREPPDWSTPKV